LTLVALDKDNKPTSVPGLVLETDEDKAEWERAKKRREIRQNQRKEGIDLYE